MSDDDTFLKEMEGTDDLETCYSVPNSEVSRLSNICRRYKAALEEIRNTAWSDERVNPMKYIARHALGET